MNSGLDITISVILTGVLMLLLMNLNARVTEENQRSVINSLPQQAATDFRRLLDNDISKIGYGMPKPSLSILTADTNALRFTYNASNNLSVYDSTCINYTVVRPTYNASTGLFSNGRRVVDSLPNTKEIFIYRTVSNASSSAQRLVSIGATRIRFDYYNSTGTAIATPVSSANLSKIRLIQVQVTIEGKYRLASDSLRGDRGFPAVSFNKYYRPRNMIF